MIGGHSARFNSILSVSTKIVSMGVAIMSVPILLQLIGVENYGTWVTLTSLLAWVAMLDLGIGNSLRNSVGSLVDVAGEATLQWEFLSFFRLLTMVGIGTATVLLGASLWFPLLSENRAVVFVLYLPALLLLPLLLGASVLQGARALGLQSLITSAGVWFFFGYIFVLQWSEVGKVNLMGVAVVWSVFRVISLVISFKLALSYLKLHPQQLLKKLSGGLPTARLKVGLSFLVLQVSSMVLYSMGNVIIYQGLGSAEVARYDILNKIFLIGLSFFSIVISIAWANISRLRALKDYPALQVLYRKVMALALGFILCAFGIAAFASKVVQVWTDGRIEVTEHEAFAIAALVSIQAVAYVGAVFMNAFEIIQLQVVLAGFSILLMFPIAHIFLSMGYGIRAVPLASGMLTLLPMLVCNWKALALIGTPRKLQ